MKWWMLRDHRDLGGSGETSDAGDGGDETKQGHETDETKQGHETDETKQETSDAGDGGDETKQETSGDQAFLTYREKLGLSMFDSEDAAREGLAQLRQTVTQTQQENARMRQLIGTYLASRGEDKSPAGKQVPEMTDEDREFAEKLDRLGYVRKEQLQPLESRAQEFEVRAAAQEFLDVLGGIEELAPVASHFRANYADPVNRFPAPGKVPVWDQIQAVLNANPALRAAGPAIIPVILQNIKAAKPGTKVPAVPADKKTRATGAPPRGGGQKPMSMEEYMKLSPAEMEKELRRESA